MATIKVFTVSGVKELKCFDSYEEVPFDTGFEDDMLPEFVSEEDIE